MIDQWLTMFEEKVNTVLTELKGKNVVNTHTDLEKQNKNLQDMVSHYKQIIDDTVSISCISVAIEFNVGQRIY